MLNGLELFYIMINITLPFLHFWGVGHVISICGVKNPPGVPEIQKARAY